MANTIFKDKTLLITGGTGSFGHTVLKHFLTTDIGEIRIFSRDEKKQDDMRHELQANYPDYYNKVKFYIGDVRNIQSLRDVMPGVNFIFHAAALKQVPSCEFFPMQAVQTNIIGTDNVLHAAIDADDILHGSDALRIMDIIEISRVEKFRILRDPVIELLGAHREIPGGETGVKFFFCICELSCFPEV